MEKDYKNIAVENGRQYLIAAKKIFQKDSHKMIEINHYNHNIEPNFWNIMLGDLKNNQKFIGKSCFEYGCGAGRNLVNMTVMGGFHRADGIDISKSNAINAQNFAENKLKSYGTQVMCLEGDGYTCFPFRDESYDFIISHQVFIHIPNHSVRTSIVADIKRIMKSGGIFITHFKTIDNSAGYFENYNKFPKNVQPVDKQQIINDFSQFGFADLKIFEVDNFYDGKPEWFVRCVKL
jgi:SAM-dependent methyltransferase